MAKKTYRRNTPPRMLDSVAGMVVRLGLSSRTGIITITGRTSSEPRSMPIDPHPRPGHLRLMDIYGARSWVLTRRADPACRVRSRDGETAYRATELPAAEGAPVFHRYLHGSSVVRDYQDVGPDDSDEAMREAAAERPVFRLDPAAG